MKWKECSHKWKMNQKEWWVDGSCEEPAVFGYIKCKKCKLEMYMQSQLPIEKCVECGEPQGICPDLHGCLEVTA